MLEPNNLGEFAFALCVTGIGLFLAAGFIAGMIVATLGDAIPKERQTIVLWTAIILVWLLFQVAVVQMLRLHARTWPAIVREDRQMHYLEWATLLFCCIAELLTGKEDHGVVQGLRYLFGGWMLLLIAAHVVTYALFRVSVAAKQALVWTILALATAWVFRPAV